MKDDNQFGYSEATVAGRGVMGISWTALFLAHGYPFRRNRGAA